MNKMILEQTEPYNYLTRELFIRAKYKDDFIYPRGKVLEVEKGCIDSGQYLQLNCIEKNQKIITARYRVYGCPHTIASIEWLCEQIEGKTIDDLNKIELDNLKILLLIPVEKTSLVLLLEDVMDEIRLQLDLK